MTPVESKCKDCIFFHVLDFDKLSCEAYPNGIPDKIIDGIVGHDKINPDQEGEFIFESSED